MARRNLIIIHRGPEYERDFAEIAAKNCAMPSRDQRLPGDPDAAARDLMIGQFGAFDIAADVLALKTAELAA
jgi:hypothetical protein